MDQILLLQFEDLGCSFAGKYLPATGSDHIEELIDRGYIQTAY